MTNNPKQLVTKKDLGKKTVNGSMIKVPKIPNPYKSNQNFEDDPDNVFYEEEGFKEMSNNNW